MAEKFLELLSTPAVARAQAHYYGRSQALPGGAARDALTADETQFIESRDNFYLSTVSESGWPYVQHRGGPPGFLHLVSPTSLAFSDYTGNRQLLTTGNLATNDRVCLFLMDYPQRTRLKILGHARSVDARTHPELVARFAAPDAQRRVERVVLIEVVSFDWNCPKYITPRYTVAEVQALVQPLQQRIAELENQLAHKPS